MTQNVTFDHLLHKYDILPLVAVVTQNVHLSSGIYKGVPNFCSYIMDESNQEKKVFSPILGKSFLPNYPKKELKKSFFMKRKENRVDFHP